MTAGKRLPCMDIPVWDSRAPEERAHHWYQWVVVFAGMPESMDLGPLIEMNLAAAEREASGYLGTIEHTPEVAPWVLEYRLKGVS